MTSPTWDGKPGTLTADAAAQLSVPAVLHLVAARLWLVAVSLGSPVGTEVLAGQLEPVRRALDEAEAALSDVLVGLRAIYATLLRTDAHDAHTGVVVLEDSAWLWREQVRGLRLDLDTLPKGAADLCTDFGALANIVRLHARAVRSVAQRAQFAANPPAHPLQLVPADTASAPPDACAGCGAVEFPHGDGCPVAARLALRSASHAHVMDAARLAGFTEEQADAAELALWERGYVFEACHEGYFSARHVVGDFFIARPTLPGLLSAVSLRAEGAP
jgi:hypothetical protein